MNKSIASLAAVLAAFLAATSTFAAEPTKKDLKRFNPTPAPHVPPKQQPLPTPTPTPPIPKPGPVLIPDTTPKH